MNKEAKAALVWRFRARIHEIYVREHSLPGWAVTHPEQRSSSRKLHIHLVLDESMTDDVINALRLAMRTGEPLILTENNADD